MVGVYETPLPTRSGHWGLLMRLLLRDIKSVHPAKPKHHYVAPPYCRCTLINPVLEKEKGP